MNCHRAQECMSDHLSGELHGEMAAQFDAHMKQCERCSTDFEEVARHWEELSRVSVPPPSNAMREQFYAALQAYQDGREDRTGSRRFWWWWPEQPAFQFAVAVGCLVLGLTLGQFASGGGGAEEMSALRKEDGNMRQLVTLSLLQQQSASDRLRGVTWSYRTEPSDMEVLSALLQTINHDGSVDVRLAAVDAVRNFGDSSVVQKGLIQAVAKQNSPLVQIAIVDALVDVRATEGIPELELMLRRDRLDENVRKRIERAVQVLRQ